MVIAYRDKKVCRCLCAFSCAASMGYTLLASKAAMGYNVRLLDSENRATLSQRSYQRVDDGVAVTAWQSSSSMHKRRQQEHLE
jgi:hypothetical protein